MPPPESPLSISPQGVRFIGLLDMGSPTTQADVDALEPRDVAAIGRLSMEGKLKAPSAGGLRRTESMGWMDQVPAIGGPGMLSPGQPGYEDAKGLNVIRSQRAQEAQPQPFNTPADLWQGVKAAAADPGAAIAGGYEGTVGAAVRGAYRARANVRDMMGYDPEGTAATRAMVNAYADQVDRQHAASPASNFGAVAGQSVPSAAMLIASRGRLPGAPLVTGAALGMMGAGAAESGMRQYEAAAGPNMSPGKSLAIGAAYAAVEALFEKVGIDKTGEVAGQAANQMAQAILRRDAASLGKMLVNVGVAGAVNATEEGATQIAQNIIDKVAYAPQTDVFEGVPQSMMIGGLQGLALGGGGAAIEGGARLALRQTTQPAPNPINPPAEALPREAPRISDAQVPGVVGAEPGGDAAPVGGGADQGQSIPDAVLAQRAAAALAEAEAVGREEAGAGLPMSDLSGLEPPIRAAYQRGYRRAGGKSDAPTSESEPAGAAGAASPASAADQAGNVAVPAADGSTPPPLEGRVGGVVRPGGEAPGARPGDVGRVDDGLERMNTQQLRAEAERAGVKVGGGRWATIGRIRDARAVQDQAGAPSGVQVPAQPQGDRGTADQGGPVPGAANVRQPAPTLEAGVGPVVARQGAQAEPQPGDVGAPTDGQLRERLAAGGINLSPKAKRETMVDAVKRLDSIEQAARQRLNTRQIPRGRNVGASIIGAELRDHAIIAAVRVAKAGVRTAEALNSAIKAVADELGRTLSEPERRRVFQVARRIILDAGKDGANIEQAVAAAQARHPEGSTPQTTGLPEGSTKSKVINTTGQRDAADAGTVSERQALRGTMKGQERAAKAAYAEGVKEGKAKAEAAATPRETLKQRIARVSGITDAADEKSVSERKALVAVMKAQRRAAREAWQNATREAAAKAEAEIHDLRGKVQNAAEMRRRVVALVKKVAPPELAKRFIAAAASVKTEQDVDAVAERLLLALSEFRARQAKAEAAKVAKRVDPDKAYEEDVRKEMRGAQEEIGKLGKQLAEQKRLLAEAEAKAREIKDANARAIALVNTRAKRAEAMDSLRAEFNDQKNRLMEANAINRQQREIWSEGRRIEKGAVIADVVENAKRRSKLDSEAGLPRDQNAPWYRAWPRKLMNRATLGQLIGGRMGKMLVEDVWAGESSLYDLWMQGRDAIKQAAEAAGFEWGSEELRQISEATYGRKVERLAMELPGGRTVEASPAEWMTVYALLGDEAHGHNLMRGAPIIFARERITGDPIAMDRATADAIRRQLDPRLTRMVDELKRWYARNVTPKEAEAFREHFGMAMEKFHGYFRAKRIPADPRAQQEMLDQQTSGTLDSQPKLSGMGAWKLRDETAIKAPYLVGDFFTTFDSMVKESAARIYLNKTVRSLQVLLRDPQVQKWTAGVYGRDLLKTLNELATESAVVFRNPRLDSTSGKVISAAQRNLARAYLKLAYSPALKNLGGVLKLGAVIDEKYLAPAVKSAFDGSIYRRAVDGSAYLRYRHEQSAALRAAASTDKGESDLLGAPKKSELVRRGRVGELTDRIPLMEWADARATVVAWKAHELQVEAEHPDWSAEQKRDWVRVRTERAIRLTQNPTTTIDKSRLQARHVDDIQSLMLMFKSDSLASANLLMQGAMGGPKQLARNLAYVTANNAWAAAVTAALTTAPAFLGAAAGGRDDEEKYRKNRRSFGRLFGQELVNNTAGMVPLFGDVVAERDAWLSDKGATPELATNPVSRLLTNTVKSTIALRRGIAARSQAHTDEAVAAANKRTMEALGDFALNLSSGAGLPVAPTATIFRRFAQGYGAEPDSATVYKAATDALKDGDPTEARHALQTLIQFGDPKEKGKRARAALEAMADRGPKGKATNAEWVARLRAMDQQERAALMREQAEWEAKAKRVIVEALRESESPPAKSTAPQPSPR